MKKQIVFIILLLLLVYFFVINNESTDIFQYVYYENFLSANDLSLLNQELETYNKNLENSLENLPNVYRFNTKIESDVIKNIIQSYTHIIKKLTSNNRIYLAKNFPIEYRKYIKDSFMERHVDQLIYKIPQYECLLTLTNSTDSYTIFGNKKITTRPNSLVILQAQGIEHEVTKVTQGERKFLKFIFTETDQFA